MVLTERFCNHIYMIRTFLLLVSLILPVLIYAQETIKGRIKAANGNPVEYATVSVDSIFTLSDEKETSRCIFQKDIQMTCIFLISVLSLGQFLEASMSLGI